MICSVRSGDCYRYYETPHPPAIQGGLGGLRGTNGLGIALDQALPPLPAGSKPAGSGVVARGAICRAGGLTGLAGLAGAAGSDVAAALVLSGLGLLALYYVGKQI